HVGSEYGRVTASIGMASSTPGQDGDPGALIKAADEALYYAKATGRNKVSTFPVDGYATLRPAAVEVRRCC
ncbi:MULTISPECIES: diguanylate cyclase domain-containing protein, partial [Burkholderia]